ncbi:uncharacterized protein LOC123524822 [Mercenaria mercenaria]|uniref:uncharacterized protein LOC123524822 n=1 Tax=Mercenaria mercenaria TaxID=6596 RepID=UPI00234EAC18|nr:uncharacterized protein LOC123524822 [Mercenaria mercenaria]
MGFSGVLQLVGFVTPGWYRDTFKYKDESVIRNFGVWYLVKCKRDTCITEQHLDSEYYMEGFHPNRPLQVQLTVALLACVFAVGLIVKSRKCTGPTLMKRLAVTAYISVISGLLSLAPAANVAAIHFFYTDSYRPFLFPYSAFLIGLGGILALTVSLISLHQIRSTQTTNGPLLQSSSAENQDDCNSTLL